MRKFLTRFCTPGGLQGKVIFFIAINNVDSGRVYK